LVYLLGSFNHPTKYESVTMNISREARAAKPLKAAREITNETAEKKQRIKAP
jgi:hypothetical protein